ncbi:MAG: FAD:protein FMN transferase [Thiobacillus sp.]|nr:FAD:protein FMN transferase [Thiobacillus sp.]
MNPIAAASPQHGGALTRARPLLGTLVEISARGASTQALNTAIEQAFVAVERIQSLMSYHDPKSDVSQLNRSGTTGITVDPHTWFVLDTARSIAEASNGLFDISIAPELVREGYLPHHADFAPADAAANWQHIELLPDHRVRFSRPLHIDLGGIAKGYAVDCALGALQDAGLLAGRVNAGGDLRLFGEAAETIRVRHPGAATQLLPLCQLREGAVATSASYFSQRQHQGRVVTPLINAATRQPCIDIRSVSVLTDQCMLADALTKVVFAEPDRAIAVLDHFGAHAVMIDADPTLPAYCRVRLSDSTGWRDALPEVAAE